MISCTKLDREGMHDCFKQSHCSTGCCGPVNADRCMINAGPEPGLTNGVQQPSMAPALQPIADALSKAEAAARRSEAMIPTQPTQVCASFAAQDPAQKGMA